MVLSFVPLFIIKDSDLSNWERLYFDSLDKDVLIMMMNAANYMGINALIASGSSYVAEIISVVYFTSFFIA